MYTDGQVQTRYIVRFEQKVPAVQIGSGVADLTDEATCPNLSILHSLHVCRRSSHTFTAKRSCVTSNPGINADFAPDSALSSQPFNDFCGLVCQVFGRGASCPRPEDQFWSF